MTSDEDRVSVVVSLTLLLQEAKTAHEKLEHEHAQGKVVLTVD